MTTHNIVSVCGCKDSTSTLLMAIYLLCCELDATVSSLDHSRATLTKITQSAARAKLQLSQFNFKVPHSSYQIEVGLNHLRVRQADNVDCVQLVYVNTSHFTRLIEASPHVKGDMMGRQLLSNILTSLGDELNRLENHKLLFCLLGIVTSILLPSNPDGNKDGAYRSDRLYPARSLFFSVEKVQDSESATPQRTNREEKPDNPQRSKPHAHRYVDSKHLVQPLSQLKSPIVPVSQNPVHGGKP
ncbi:hypothetical protein QYE80_08255 [Pseudomonas tohonis]|nr:hypothetical protein [Pseudomonas tohonis]